MMSLFLDFRLWSKLSQKLIYHFCYFLICSPVSNFWQEHDLSINSFWICFISKFLMLRENLLMFYKSHICEFLSDFLYFAPLLVSSRLLKKLGY